MFLAPSFTIFSYSAWTTREKNPWKDVQAPGALWGAVLLVLSCCLSAHSPAKLCCAVPTACELQLSWACWIPEELHHWRSERETGRKGEDRGTCTLLFVSASCHHWCHLWLLSMTSSSNCRTSLPGAPQRLAPESHPLLRDWTPSLLCIPGSPSRSNLCLLGFFLWGTRFSPFPPDLVIFEFPFGFFDPLVVEEIVVKFPHICDFSEIPPVFDLQFVEVQFPLL